MIAIARSSDWADAVDEGDGEVGRMTGFGNGKRRDFKPGRRGLEGWWTAVCAHGGPTVASGDNDTPSDPHYARSR